MKNCQICDELIDELGLRLGDKICIKCLEKLDDNHFDEINEYDYDI